tara:strand:- start:311 stop:2737 length:2427 start_codon:yes stop_codon:yes gene_type:complete
MKISYNWLKEYLDITDNYKLVAEKLTDLGLEVEGTSKYESIPGSLEGVVVGKIISLKKHPNADRLKVTTVDIGSENNIQIVCGAPNVDINQTVAVATCGTILFPNNKKLKIKKSKIRGEESNGMICGKDELNLGEFDEGIMLLENKHKAGTLLKDIFSTESDWIFEIGLTPNRADAMSHFGVARDLRCKLIHEGNKIKLKTPSVSNFIVDKRTNNIKVTIENENIVRRYCGIVMENITIAESPLWLQNRLKSIGITPTNNVVDVTNFVMHDIGQPLHAFDYDKIEGNTIIVKRNKKETKFIALDETEHFVTKNDLMIYDAKQPLCIAGIYGGMHSGISKSTTTIFLESAYFDPICIRKSAKHHNLSTDSSYRFERGVDPAITKYALKRAALLLKDICKEALISSDIIDLYPKTIEDTQVILGFNKIQKTIGQHIEKEIVKNIISSLDIKINSITESKLGLLVPSYRNDVKREADVIEEILRIYGYNNIKSSNKINQSIKLEKSSVKNKLTNTIADHLVSLGFYEIMTNSLISFKQNKLNLDKEKLNNVDVINYSSIDQSQLKNSMIFSGLNSIKHNVNRKNGDLKLFEFGKEYFKDKGKYNENEKLAIFIYGNKNQNNWNEKEKKSDYFFLKGIVKSITEKIGFNKIKAKPVLTDNLQEGESLFFKKFEIIRYGIINNSICNQFEIESEVYYAEFDIKNILKNILDKPILYKQISKFPEVSRDLSILIDDKINYDKIHNSIKQINQKLIRDISLFDVYRGEKLPKNKKSYGLAFKILDNDKTLSEKEIDGLMEQIILKLKKEFKAELR